MELLFQHQAQWILWFGHQAHSSDEESSVCTHVAVRRFGQAAMCVDMPHLARVRLPLPDARTKATYIHTHMPWHNIGQAHGACKAYVLYRCLVGGSLSEQNGSYCGLFKPHTRGESYGARDNRAGADGAGQLSFAFIPFLRHC